jgi:transglutaminase/protease-like cytokinesis protein 3
MNVLQTVLGDNPSVIYFDKTKIQVEKSGSKKQIHLTGVHPKPQVEKMNLALDKAANKIVLAVKESSDNQYSTLINIYKYLQKNVQYDNKEFNAVVKGKIKNVASHNAYGAIINKLAVCDGFSSAFSLLVQKLGFKCMLVFGRSAYTSAALSNHAWNIIKVRNQYYHFDITWDARKFNELSLFSYVYFAMSDVEITNDHKWNKTTTPACTDDNFSYYSKNGLYIIDKEQLDDVIKEFCRDSSVVLQLKLSRNIKLPNNAGKHLIQMILKRITKPGMKTRASYGWNANTRCFFARIIN